MSIQPPRQAFSLNLYEDYEIYGIDPDEDLNDWSFLDQKPEPIPEKSEEEKRLFEALLAPSIPDEEIQSEIHDRLKSLLAETDEFIQNDVKVELSSPIEISPEEIKPLIDEDSFEHKQAAKVSSLVKDLLNTSQEAESIDDLIKTLTKSDEVADQISKEIEEPISSNLDLKIQSENEIEEPKLIEPPNPIEKPTTGLLNRYIQKPSEKIKIIKNQDETERLSSQFLLERKKRQEEAEPELKRKQEEMERKQKEFFESIAKEKEKHQREVQMIKEMKENHGPSFSEMLSSIKKPVEQPKPNPALKPKQQKPTKEPRMSEEKISQFYAQREIKLNAAMKKPETPLLIIDLQTNHPNDDEIKKGQHISNKYKTSVLAELGKILIPKIKKYLESHNKKQNEGQKLKIALFIRMMTQLKLNSCKKEVQKKILLRKIITQWRQKRLFLSLTKTIAAYKIQAAFKIYDQKRKVELSLQKARQAAEIAKQSIEEHNAEITQEQLLDKTRQMLNARIQIDDNKTKKNLPNLPELPDMNDLDWADRFRINNDMTDFSDDDEFLATLPEYLPVENQRQIHTPVVAESESVPLEVADYDYLAGFNQHIDLNDDNTNETNDNQEQQQNTPVRSPAPRPPPQQPVPPVQPQFGENEGYHFDNPRTAAMMQAMQKRRQNFANKNIRENPIDKFQRLYGKKKNTPPPFQGQNHQEEFVPVVRRSEFKKNDARAKRLMKLKQVWLHPPDGSDQ